MFGWISGHKKSREHFSALDTLLTMFMIFSDLPVVDTLKTHGRRSVCKSLGRTKDYPCCFNIWRRFLSCPLWLIIIIAHLFGTLLGQKTNEKRMISLYLYCVDLSPISSNKTAVFSLHLGIPSRHIVSSKNVPPVFGWLFGHNKSREHISALGDLCCQCFSALRSIIRIPYSVGTLLG